MFIDKNAKESEKSKESKILPQSNFSGRKFVIVHRPFSTGVGEFWLEGQVGVPVHYYPVPQCI